VSDHPFYRLAPFIQEYIYAHGWTELRAVQVEACRVVFETDAHLLLATGTASGKTEAAFLPVLTLLQEQPSSTVGVLYIGPTKALINDQFYRLTDLLTEARIPVWEWHGDVSQSQKTKLLRAPSGVLQITPESLESLLVNRGADLQRLLGDLRFIVIDEVHVFMGSDRGRQVLCQLARLRRFIQEEPRRIGLSATLGDYSVAEAWLASGSTRSVMTPQITGTPQRLRLAVEHFYVAADQSKRGKTVDALAKGHAGDADELPRDETDAYVRYIFEQSVGRKCLIFANSRGETERVVATLRRIAEAERLPDVYHVHHGSIAAPLREAAETAMRESAGPAITAATITLELGIDIGQLERVIQLSAPFSVSSFLQRLGRSGRRGSPAEMWLVCPEPSPSATESLPQQIPWSLLQAIAIIQLYVEDRWIEPLQPLQYPFSLLYHQTMSTLAGVGELSPAALAQRVLTLPPFRHVSEVDFRTLLLHLIEIDHIQTTAEGGLIVGLTGEKVVRTFHFYAVFPDNEEFTVRDETREIGSIVMPPPPGERFALAGRTWETVEVDTKRKVVFVKLVRGTAAIGWHGTGGTIHSRVVERMRRVLLEDVDYSYLQPRARTRLEQARHLARESGLERGYVFSLGGHVYCVLPWVGSLQYRTLDRYLRALGHETVHVASVAGLSPYFLTVRTNPIEPAALQRAIASLADEEIDLDLLLGSDDAPQLQKYDEFIPPVLLRKAFVADYLDIAGLKTALAGWRLA
jgi:ATP-dependent Lhr-like helicase